MTHSAFNNLLKGAMTFPIYNHVLAEHQHGGFVITLSIPLAVALPNASGADECKYLA